ncbi:MAG: 30S ribosomal protein S6 [Deltaproteobacteria bacterium]|nr:MAG: 30S ribosomal protein S6 [Deltaproteobacteria bacterium]
MRRYETIIIIDPDLGKEARATLFEQVRDQIDQFSGQLIKFDEWGNRQLAYKIRKKPRGHFVRLDYCGTIELVDEMERRFKINDSFLKFMTVLLDREVDMAAIEAEIAEIAEQEEKAATARAEALAAAEQAAAEKAEGAKKDATLTDDTSPESETPKDAEDSKRPAAADSPESETAVPDEKETTDTSADDPDSNEKE